LAWRRNDAVWMGLLAITIASKNFVFNTVSIMEWPWVIFLSTAKDSIFE